MRTKTILSLLLLPLLLVLPASGQLTMPDDLVGQDAEVDDSPVTLEEIVAIVAEFETVVPQYSAYRYPIDISINPSDAVNAGAGLWEKPDDDGSTYFQAILEVNQGFLDATNNDRRLLRAVLAHEMAHLAMGHADINANTGDLDHALTRQEELAADAYGVQYLEQLGHSRQEMIDLLLFLDGLQNKQSAIWLGTVTSDHASPVTRAGLLERDDTVLNALAHMETGLAFMECRRYEEAILWFEAALAIEPRMEEAQVNIAIASLQDYYERLPIVIREDWLTPEFVPHLTSTSLLGGRSLAITDKDRARYQEAMRRIGQIDEGGSYGRTRTILQGTAQVLIPGDAAGDREAIGAGVEILRGQLFVFPSVFPVEIQASHLRCANNMAVGLARLGRDAEAQGVLVAEGLRVPDAFLTYAAENMGRLPHGELDADQARHALNQALIYVQNTPPTAPKFAAVQAALDSLLSKLGLELTGEPATAPLWLCSAVSMTIDGQELVLFDPLEDVLGKLGDPLEASLVLDEYPDLGYLMFGPGEDITASDVFLFSERERIMKLTSYREGSFVTLRPQNRTLRETYQLTVGMTEAEFEAVIDPEGDGAYQSLAFLFGRTVVDETVFFELWNYYPTLNMGVLFEDGKVAALSVTPVK